MNKKTRLIHALDDIPPVRTLNPPLHRASTILFDCYRDLERANAGAYEGITYGTDRLPTQRAFEEALCRLEGGYLTRTFPSGINAIINTLLAFTSAGDQVLICDNAYGPSTAFCNQILAKFGVEIEVIPSNVGADILKYLKPNTRLILLESPGSNTLEIQDIPAVTALAGERGIITVLDNTWATPLYLNPFRLGIDISIHSATKYISGHSDVLLGAVTVAESRARAFDLYCRTTESFAPPEDCHLALRGLKTLGVRLKRHEQSALEIAAWLESHERVEQVIHPALPSHPEHALWKRDFTGSSGLFAFTLKEEPALDRLAAFIDGLKLFGIGYSWGGFQSLITARRHVRRLPFRYAERTIIRLSIGLEEVEDLKEDLARGLDGLR